MAVIQLLKKHKISILVVLTVLLVSTCTPKADEESTSTPTESDFSALAIEIISPSSDQNVTIGSSVNFSSDVTGGVPPYLFNWNFDTNSVGGGPNGSSSEDPGDVTFDSTNDYLVTVEVTDSSDNTAQDTVTISAGSSSEDALSASINWPVGNQTINVGDSISFTCTFAGGTAPFSHYWDFDTNNIGGGPSPSTSCFTGSKTFNTAGTYLVTLTVSDDESSPVTDTVTITVNSVGDTAPLAIEIISPLTDQSINTGSSVNFGSNVTGGTSPYTFDWNFDTNYVGGGPAYSNDEDPGDVTFDSAGEFLVTVEVTDSSTDSTQDTVMITAVAGGGSALSASINSPSGDRIITSGSSVYFSCNIYGGTAPYIFSWDFDTNNSGGGPTASTICTPGTVSFNSAGTYLVTFSVTDSGFNTITDSVTITVPSIMATINTPIGNESISVGDSVNFTASASYGTSPYSYLWDFDTNNIGGGPVEDTSDSPGETIFSNPGSYLVTFTATDDFSMATSDIRTVVVYPEGTSLAVDINNPSVDQNITEDDNINFQGSVYGGTKPYTYSWNFDTTSTNRGPASSTVQDPGNTTFSNAGDFLVTFTATDASGDSTSDTVAVTASTGLGLKFSFLSPSDDVVIPPGGTVTFEAEVTTATSDYFRWDFNHSGPGGATPSTYETDLGPIEVTFPEEGTYIVRLRVRDEDYDSFYKTTPVTVALETPDEALFSNGANWNYYVKNDGTGDTLAEQILSSSNTACNPATDGPGVTSCFNGGEVRAFEVAGQSSCTGLTATDSLGVFDWVCDDSTSEVQMVSTGLKEGKKLSDLLDFDTPGWLPNSIAVTTASGDLPTFPSSIWWNNPVVEDNDGMSSGEAITGTIYIITDDPMSGYEIDKSKTALVVEPGITATGYGTFAQVYTSNADFFWIEGSFGVNGDGSGTGVYLSNADFSVARNISVSNALTGMSISANSSRISDLTSESSSSAGINIWAEGSTVSRLVSNADDNGISISCTNCMISDLTSDLTDGYNEGIQFLGSNNTISNVVAINGNGTGIDINGNNNVFTNLSVNSIDSSNEYFYGVYFNSSSSGNRISDMTIDGTNQGLYLHGNSNTLSQLSVFNSTEYGILMQGNGHRLSDVLTTNNGAYGIHVSSEFSMVWNLVSSNNAENGVLVGSGNGGPRDNNILTGITSVNNGRNSLEGDNGGRFFIYQNITLANAEHTTLSYDGRGYYAEEDYTVLQNLAVFNNAATGLDLASLISGMTLNNTAVIGNGKNPYSSNYDQGIDLEGDNITFTGFLFVGNNGPDDSRNCDIDGSAINPGLNNDCNIAGDSDAIVDASADTAPEFVGGISNDDSINQSDTSGQATYDTITDFTEFENSFRTWGRDATNDLARQGDCVSGETCRISDWSLQNTDTVLLNVTTTIPTGDDTLSKIMGVSSTECAYVGGIWNSDTNLCSLIFLRNAVEIQDDDIGNENTLCESGETCLFSPNIGSYQGHGNLISAGTFVDGALTDITLMKYESNGR